jgi:hypothetical protein
LFEGIRDQNPFRWAREWEWEWEWEWEDSNLAIESRVLLLLSPLRS